jgi:hypothetical protein
MQRVMQNNAAVFRTQETLEEGTNATPDFIYANHMQLLIPYTPS